MKISTTSNVFNQNTKNPLLVQRIFAYFLNITNNSDTKARITSNVFIKFTIIYIKVNLKIQQIYISRLTLYIYLFCAYFQVCFGFKVFLSTKYLENYSNIYIIVLSLVIRSIGSMRSVKSDNFANIYTYLTM